MEEYRLQKVIFFHPQELYMPADSCKDRAVWCLEVQRSRCSNAQLHLPQLQPWPDPTSGGDRGLKYPMLSAERAVWRRWGEDWSGVTYWRLCCTACRAGGHWLAVVCWDELFRMMSPSLHSFILDNHFCRLAVWIRGLVPQSGWTPYLMWSDCKRGFEEINVGVFSTSSVISVV